MLQLHRPAVLRRTTHTSGVLRLGIVPKRPHPKGGFGGGSDIEVCLPAVIRSWVDYTTEGTGVAAPSKRVDFQLEVIVTEVVICHDQGGDLHCPRALVAANSSRGVQERTFHTSPTRERGNLPNDSIGTTLGSVPRSRVGLVLLVPRLNLPTANALAEVRSCTPSRLKSRMNPKFHRIPAQLKQPKRRMPTKGSCPVVLAAYTASCRDPGGPQLGFTYE